jgi:hypothetical protein
LNTCMPDIVRKSIDGKTINRQGLTDVELNKCLVIDGYKSIRRRVPGATARAWQTEWLGRRWVDPTTLGHHSPGRPSALLESVFRGNVPDNRHSHRYCVLCPICK